MGRWYIVPGLHYGTPSRTSFSLTGFHDGRGGIIGKGYLVSAEGARDAAKLKFGIANVSQTVGFGIQATALRVLAKPLDGIPNSTYAGIDAHVYIAVVNLGAGFYAPVGNPIKRKGLAALTMGVGF